MHSNINGIDHDDLYCVHGYGIGLNIGNEMFRLTPFFVSLVVIYQVIFRWVYFSWINHRTVLLDYSEFAHAFNNSYYRFKLFVNTKRFRKKKKKN